MLDTRFMRGGSLLGWCSMLNMRLLLHLTSLARQVLATDVPAVRRI